MGRSLIKHPLGQPGNAYRILVRNPLDNIQLEDQGDIGITLEWILWGYVNGMWVELVEDCVQWSLVV
jgi:hypothetical protein